MTMDLTAVAYATFALSLFVSAIKVGGWIVNADPRAIINAGRWSLLALAGLAIAALLWLMANERWPSAMLLMAFMLPIVVQALPRWRLLLNLAPGRFPQVIETVDEHAVPANTSPIGTRPDPELVRQSIGGRFGHRLLVAASVGARTTLFAIDCRGHGLVLSRRAPRKRCKPTATDTCACRARRRSICWAWDRRRGRTRSAMRIAG